MFNRLIFAALLMLGSLPALADECMWVNADVAKKAAPLVDGQVLQVYCPSCGDSRAKRLNANKATAAPVPNQSPYWHVVLTGDTDDLDLSYTYVQVNGGTDWLNVGLLAGCTDDDQARVLSADLIETASAASAPAAPAPPAMTPAAAATPGCTGKVRFADDFTKVDPGWQTDPNVSIGGGKMQLKVSAGDAYNVLYTEERFGDADICVNLSVSQVSNPGDAIGGVVFWQTDDDNYYSVVIDAAGNAAISRTQDGKNLFPVDWQKAPSLKTGEGAVNAIRITLKGNTIAVYFNGAAFSQIDAEQPNGGGGIGFDGEAAGDAPDVWTFTDLKITEPS